MESETHSFHKGLLDTVLRAQADKNPNFSEIYKNILSILDQSTLSATSEKLLANATANIDKLSKLLSLDVENCIDYALIRNKNTKRQLLLDNLAMSKVRYGLKQTASGILFDDYCRFAQLQAEELINFFYVEKFYEPSAIKNFVIDNNKGYRDNIASRISVEKVTDITYFYKIFAFNQAYQLDGYWTLIQVSYVRNQASHRCSITGDKEDELMCDYEIRRLAGKFRNDLTYADQQLHDKCEKIMFRRNAEYDKVSSALHALYQKVVANLV